MIQDVRHAFRMMRNTKGWTLVVVLSLALGIGANAALFSAVNGLLLDTLPVENPDSLVRLRWTGQHRLSVSSSEYGFSAPIDGQNVRTTVSAPLFRQLQADNRTLVGLAATASYGQMNMVVDGRADIAIGTIVSGNLLPLLGVQPTRGRTLLPEDDASAAPPVVMVSARYWQSRFGGDPDVVGTVVQLNSVPVTIVGVLPASFTGIARPVGGEADVWFPLALEDTITPFASRLSLPTTWWLQMVGRLRPGVTASQVEGNLAGVFQGTALSGFDSYVAGLTDPLARARVEGVDRTVLPRLIVDSARHGMYDVNAEERLMAAILAGVVGLMLLIVCANVASLLLSRASVRQRELAVRRSLGATRGRLVRQLLTESLLLAFMGGALGLLVGYWGRSLLPGDMGESIALDATLLWFLLALTTATGIVFGIAPALRASRAIGDTLKDGGRGVAGSRSRLGKTLLVVQVAVSLMLLIGAGLFLRTVQNLGRVNVGFDPTNIATFRVFPQLNRYEAARIPVLYENLAERIGAVPGVRAVAFSNQLLLSGNVNITSVFLEGRTYAATESTSLHRLVVSPGFFDTLGVPVILGRAFTNGDTTDAPRVAVINDAAARLHFPNENPIGRRLSVQRGAAATLEIVGVVRDTKYSNVREAAPPTLFVPFRQTTTPAMHFSVRTAGDPLTALGSIREAVRQVDQDLPMIGVSTQTDHIGERYEREQLFARAYALFGGMAVLLASIGLFGLMSYSVARRTNEIGIRMALGAQPRWVMRLVMRESMLLVLIGVVVGLAGAVAAGRFVASQLYEVGTIDPVTFAVATASLVGVSLVAAAIPARRAARVDPMVALRND